METKGITSSEMMKELFNNYWQEVRGAREQGKKLAYCANPFPTDFLSAMDMAMLFPSNIAATDAIRKVSTQECEVSETMGFPNDLCSYARSNLAAILLGEKTISTFGVLPKPDCIVLSTTQDHNIVKWYEYLHRIYNVPLFVLDVPFSHDDASPDVTTNAENYIKSQLKEELIPFLESVTGRRFNYDRFLECMELTRRAHVLWTEVNALRKNIPSPFTLFDQAMKYLFPLRYLRGRRETIAFYELLLEEGKSMVAQKIGSIPNEKYRLHWNGLPAYCIMGSMAKKLASYGAAALTAGYELVSRWEGLDPSRPFDSTAEVAYGAYFHRGTKAKIDAVVDLVKEYSLNGVLMTWSITCHAYTIGLQDLSEGIKRRTGLPSVLIQADTSDTRLFSEAEIDTKLESFFEVLASRHL